MVFSGVCLSFASSRRIRRWRWLTTCLHSASSSGSLRHGLRTVYTALWRHGRLRTVYTAIWRHGLRTVYTAPWRHGFGFRTVYTVYTVFTVGLDFDYPRCGSLIHAVFKPLHVARSKQCTHEFPRGQSLVRAADGLGVFLGAES